MGNDALKRQVAENKIHSFPKVDGPRPLPMHSVVAQQMTEDMIPLAWREWLADTADRLQCPLDYCVVPAVVAAAALIGNRIRIRPKVHDPWLVVPNLWGAIVGPPGIMKTPAVREAFIFFREIAESRRIAFESSRKDRDFQKEFLAAQRASLSRSMKKADADKDALRSRFESLICEEMNEERLFTTDVTVEKLGELLNENPNGLLVERDELTGFLRNLDRPGHEQYRSFFLEAWNGDGNFVFDRIGRGTVNIKNTTVSIFGTIQPAMITPYLAGAIEGGSDDGLVQRFQLIVFPEGLKEFRYTDRPPAGREEARNSFTSLASISPHEIKTKILQEKHGGHAYLQFEPEAQEFFERWLTDLEVKLRSGSFTSPAIEAHFAKYRSLLPTLALIFHLVDLAAGRIGAGMICRKYAELSAEWCNYLETHANKLYAMAIFSDVDAAREILRRIDMGHIIGDFTARDIYSNHWRGLSRPETVKSGLEVLVDHRYLDSFALDTGGRMKILYQLHQA